MSSIQVRIEGDLADRVRQRSMELGLSNAQLVRVIVRDNIEIVERVERVVYARRDFDDNEDTRRA